MSMRTRKPYGRRLYLDLGDGRLVAIRPLRSDDGRDAVELEVDAPDTVAIGWDGPDGRMRWPDREQGSG